ncbi:MAG TPA: hypothetical protein VEW69_00280 [Alphaproteobacteria bacterium]|nr:hypothetical protein [Alphaproteobacteria bacterium]
MIDENRSNTLILGIYKLATLLSGVAFAYMGYRLFLSGVFERAGQLEAAWGKDNLILKQAAPGTFFALFGCAIILMTVLRGFETRSTSRKGEGLAFQSTAAAALDGPDYARRSGKYVFVDDLEVADRTTIARFDPKHKAVVADVGPETVRAATPVEGKSKKKNRATFEEM